MNNPERQASEKNIEIKREKGSTEKKKERMRERERERECVCV